MTIIDANLEIGPRHFPVVAGFRINFCGDPNCGPHFFLLDRDGQTFCEFIMTPTQLVESEIKMHDHHAGMKK